MKDAIIWSALTASLATSIFAVWVFYRLLTNDVVVTSTGANAIVYVTMWQSIDKYNFVELGAAITILCVVVIAWVIFTIRKIRE